ncbi:MAG: hypothetical protein C5B48_15200 [Candidatus Rokuibacteriota bacterium]|nr:MAG: hypothetical protein C5B48_15200 [Candidatus Rokubacteria bacterium]
MPLGEASIRSALGTSEQTIGLDIEGDLRASRGGAPRLLAPVRGDRCYRSAVRVGEPVSSELLLAPVHDGGGLRPLAEHLRGPTLIVFLRHFG